MSILGIIALGFFVLICYLIGQGTNTFAAFAAICFLISSIALYFSPSMVAYSRKHQNLTSVFVLNLFLGWTVIGWVGALVWAYSKKAEVLAEHTSGPSTQAPIVVLDSKETKKCPFCAEEVRAEAIKCKHCGSDISSIQNDVVLPSPDSPFLTGGA